MPQSKLEDDFLIQYIVHCWHCGKMLESSIWVEDITDGYCRRLHIKLEPHECIKEKEDEQ